MIQSAQEQVEAQNFEMRKNVLKYDDVMNRQRHAIYGDRRSVLEGADVEEKLRATVTRVVTQFVENATQGFEEDWDLEQLWLDLKQLYPVSLDRSKYEGNEVTPDHLVADFTEDAQKAYDNREENLTPDVMRELERRVLLTVLDRKWREHLYEMDYLREGIGLRAMAQRDPLVEYQREGGVMFQAMMDSFMEEVVGYLFNLHVEAVQQPAPVLDDNGEPVDLLAAVKRYHDSELEAEAAAARKQLHIGAQGLTDTTPKSAKKPAKGKAAPKSVPEPEEPDDDEPMVTAAAPMTARTPSPRTSRPGTAGRRNKKR
jgi:preprotein translocase subunit SecA